MRFVGTKAELIGYLTEQAGIYRKNKDTKMADGISAAVAVIKNWEEPRSTVTVGTPGVGGSGSAGSGAGGSAGGGDGVRVGGSNWASPGGAGTQ